MKITELLTTYRQQDIAKRPKKITFIGIEKEDVYNISAPFEFLGKTYLLGRVEKRDSEFSKACFFERLSETEYKLADDAPALNLQDPFFTWINKQLIVGGVEVFEKENEPGSLEWRTVFYQVNSFEDYKHLFNGPIGMKDLRLGQLTDGKILVLTRPQGEKGGRGKIGYTVISSLSELTIALIDDAPLLDDQFLDSEWGGANEIHVLNENTVGVLGHIACFDEEDNRHYYALSFELELTTFEICNPKIIAERKDFLPGPAKRPDLEDVVFSGGLVIDGVSTQLYAGIGDAQAQKIQILNPFR